MQLTNIFYQQMEENFHLANQAERMRLIVATGNLCLATVLQIALAFVGLERRALPLTCWMVFLGGYGCFAGSKLYERETYHRQRVRVLRAKLSDLYPDADLGTLFKNIEQKQRQDHPYLMPLRLNTIWITLHVSIALIGGVYSVLCFLH